MMVPSFYVKRAAIQMQRKGLKQGGYGVTIN
jgi:hypothetical protein